MASMNIEQYQDLTGLTIPTARQNVVNSQLERTQRILETMLGFTLNTTLVNENQYTETGQTTTECPCPSTVDFTALDDPDAVVTAYRMYDYNIKDLFLFIDPVSAVNAVKLVKDGVTFRTLETTDYRLNYKQGIVKYLEQIECWCSCSNCCCAQMQLAVDADWLWDGSDDYPIPNDLLQVWADMVTYYSDPRRGVKSQTLGTHSYSKFADTKPETEEQNLNVIKKYAGPNGSAVVNVTQ